MLNFRGVSVFCFRYFSKLSKFYGATVWRTPTSWCPSGWENVSWQAKWVVLWVCIVVFSRILAFGRTKTEDLAKPSLDLVMLTRPHKVKGTWFLASQDDHVGGSGDKDLSPLRLNVEFVGMRSEHQDTRCPFQFYYDTTMIKFAWQLFEMKGLFYMSFCISFHWILVTHFGVVWFR